MIQKKVFLLLLTLCLALTFACGNAEEHDDDDGSAGGGGNLPPTNLSLIFQSNNLGVGDILHCDAPGLNWEPGIEFNQNHRAVINNAQVGTYLCNVQLENSEWVVYSSTDHLFGATVTSQQGTTVLSTYRLTQGDIFSNGMGGGNWELWLADSGTVSGPGGGDTVDPVDPVECVDPIASTDLEVVIKSYVNFDFTPQARFSGDGFTPRTMTQSAPNMYTYTYTGVATDDLYTINFEDPTTGEYLYNESGPMGPYVVIVNGVQVSEMLDDDIKVILDPCANLITSVVDLTFTFLPSDTTAYDVDVIFGLNSFLAYGMSVDGSQWTTTIYDVPPGRYEFNIRYLTATDPDVAGWPDHINGDVTVNGTAMTIYDMIIYSETVPWNEPTGTPLLMVRADFLIDVYADGTVVGVNMRDGTIGIIIPLP
ncbi:MAG: hypothetical protein GF365_00290 [Candidatus Buchananbacteria bacterium]|nr:hypothetical protein [Candidatus Buchananbacteria bacterium]